MYKRRFTAKPPAAEMNNLPFIHLCCLCSYLLSIAAACHSEITAFRRPILTNRNGGLYEEVQVREISNNPACLHHLNFTVMGLSRVVILTTLPAGGD